MARNQRLELDLPPDLAQFVHSQAGQGALTSEAEFVIGVLRQAARHDTLLAEVRRKIAEGVASLREGKGTDGEAFMAALDAELMQQERNGG